MNKNLEYIIGKAVIKPVKFNSLDKAKLYLNQRVININKTTVIKKIEVCYEKRFGWVKLYSTKDYLNDTTMEQGTVWNIIKLKSYYEE